MTAQPGQPIVDVIAVAHWPDRTARPAQINVLVDGVVVFSDKVSLVSALSRGRCAAGAADSHPAVVKTFVLAELQRILNDAEMSPPPESDPPEHVLYEPAGNTLLWNRPTPQGTVPTPLTTFTATILAVNTIDNGADKQITYTIAGHAERGPAATFQVKDADFEAMTWVSRELGVHAFVHAGPLFKTHAANAIRALSPDPRQEMVYAHTGWRFVGGVWLYLHSGGAIASTGLREDVQVSLGEEKLVPFALPAPPTGEAEQQAVRALVAVLDRIDVAISVPVFGAALRAPLGDARLSVHLVGETGVFKSTIASLAQRCFGVSMHEGNLPAHWSATANTLLMHAFLIKDALLVIDEFKPKGSQREIDQLHAKADEVLRGQANHSGRGRLTRDLQMRHTMPPRGLILSTGEDTPRGESLRARIVVVELEQPLSVAAQHTLEAQLQLCRDDAAQGLYAQAMAGYLRWCAGRYDALQTWRIEEESDAAVRALARGSHARTPGNLAQLYAGWSAFVGYATGCGALTDAEGVALLERVWNALSATGVAQARQLVGEDECSRFLGALRSALRSGAAHVALASTGDVPDHEAASATLWGWRRNDKGDWTAGNSPRVGWLADNGLLYLEPGAAYSAASDVLHKHGQAIGLDGPTLHKRLHKRGLLAVTDGAHLRPKRVVDGSSLRVLVLHAAHLLDGGDDGPTDPLPTNSALISPLEPGSWGAESGEPWGDSGETQAQKGEAIIKYSLENPEIPTIPTDGERIESYAYVIDGGVRSEHTQNALLALSYTDALSTVPIRGVSGERGDIAPKVAIVRDSEALAGAVARILAAPAVGFDTETTGLNPHSDRLRLAQFALPDGTVYVIDADAVDLAPLAPVFSGVDGPIVCGHNLQFDLRFAVSAGLPWIDNRRTFCTQIASQLLRASATRAARGTHSLAGAAKFWLKETLDKEQQRSDWSATLSDEQIAYAAKDAYTTLRLAAAQAVDLEQTDMQRVAAIEMACVPALAWLQWSGAPFDSTAWIAVSDAAQTRVIELLDRMNALAGETDMLGGSTVNWGSPEQVRGVLARRGVDIPATHEAYLLSVADRDPLVPLLLEYREASKRLGTYGPEIVQRFVQDDRIYADFFQCGSDAGRMSASNPNTQNIPRSPEYRRCFRPPAGRVLVKADYGQIELRIAAEIAPDKALIDAFQRGEDPHRITAAAVAGVAAEAVTKDQRQLAKAVNFGLLYGMGAARLREYAANSYGVAMSDEDAETARKRFFKTYPGLRKWHRSVKDGYTATRTLTGRRRLNVDSFTAKLNSPVQGTGADVLKLALATLYADRACFPSAFPVLVVHDEIVLEADAADALAVAAWLKGHMEAAGAAILATVPVEAEPTIIADWSGTAVLA